MISKVMKADHVRLARVRYNDIHNKGVEIDDIDAYAFLLKAGESYINIFDITSGYPVFERMPYSNTTSDGEDYGTKLIQISGDRNKSGLCYVLEDITARNLFNLDEVTEDLLKEYIIRSNKFFVDRKSILQDTPSFMKKVGALPKLLKDEKKHMRLQRFIESHNTGKSY